MRTVAVHDDRAPFDDEVVRVMRAAPHAGVVALSREPVSDGA